MTKLEMMRAAAAANKAPEPSAPAGKIIPPQDGSGTAPPKPKNKSKKADLTGPPVQHRCGHVLPADYYLTCECGKCLRKLAQERAIRQKAKRAARLAASMEKQTAVRTTTEGRLPDGAVFSVQYDATTQTWSGELAVPGVPMFTYTGQASGVFKLLAALDAQYRQSSTEGEQSCSTPK